MTERRAYVCYDKDGSIVRRIFLTPDEPDEVPRCQQSGPAGKGGCPNYGRPMKRDSNRPYNLKALIAEAEATRARIQARLDQE